VYIDFGPGDPVGRFLSELDNLADNRIPSRGLRSDRRRNREHDRRRDNPKRGASEARPHLATPFSRVQRPM
jgi:hypothetical protein